MKLALSALSILFVAACGRMNLQAIPDTAALLQAQATLDGLEPSSEGRGFLGSQNRTTRVFFGAGKGNRDCRTWSLRIGALGHAKVTLQKVLRSEKKQGDGASMRSGVVYVEALTKGGLDGVEVSLPREATLTVNGIVRDCVKGKVRGEVDLQQAAGAEGYQPIGNGHFILISK